MGATTWMTARSSGESSSISETSRASARGSPACAAETSASGSATDATATERTVTARAGRAGGWHAEQQRVALATAAAQRRGAEPAAAAAQLTDQVQRDPGAGRAER